MILVMTATTVIVIMTLAALLHATPPPIVTETRTLPAGTIHQFEGGHQTVELRTGTSPLSPSSHLPRYPHHFRKLSYYIEPNHDAADLQTALTEEEADLHPGTHLPEPLSSNSNFLFSPYLIFLIGTEHVARSQGTYLLTLLALYLFNTFSEILRTRTTPSHPAPSTDAGPLPTPCNLLHPSFLFFSPPSLH